MKNPSRYSIDILDIAFDLLEFMQKDNAEFQKLNNIAKNLNLNRNRVFRILKTLEYRGYVEFDSQVQGYRLGLKFLTFNESIHMNTNLRKEVAPILIELSQKTGEACFLYVLIEDRAICIDFVPGNNILQVATIIGESLPLHVGGAPKVLLAFLAEEERERIIQKIELTPLTSYTITERNVLREGLNKIRAQGYSISQEDIELGACAFGAPVRNHKNKVIASISIAMPVVRFTDERKQFLLEQIVNAASNLSRKLGFQDQISEKIKS